MKLTKREAFLLKLVSFVALLALSYYFIIAPQLERLAETEQNLALKSSEVETIESEIQSLPLLEEEIASLQEEIRVSTKTFYPELRQKKLIVILDEQLKQSGTAADSLTFSQVNSEESTEDLGTDNEQTEENSYVNSNGEPVKTVLQSISIQVPFTGSYEQIIDLIRRLEDMNRTFVINSLQLSQGTDGTISGTINLDFYSLKKLFPDPQDEDYLSWPYNTPKGIDNPFRFIESEESVSEDDLETTAPEGTESLPESENQDEEQP